MTESLTAGEMFAGYGGLATAVHSAFGGRGVLVRTAWLAEPAAAPSRILAHRYPGVPNLGDVTTIDWADPAHAVDIIAGGSPCQDVSGAGRRAGMTEGTRSNLWVAQREAIATIRPQWAVWENVRGAYSAQAHSDLEPCPGCLGGHEGGGQSLFCGHSDVFSGTFPASGMTLSGVAYELRTWEHRTGDTGSSFSPDDETDGLLRTPCATEDEGGPLHPDVAAARGQTLRLTGQILAMTGDLLPTPRASDQNSPGVHGNGGQDLRTTVDLKLLPTPQANIAANGGSQDPAKRRAGGHSVSIKDVVEHPAGWGRFAPAIRRWERVLGRWAPEPTVPGRKGGRARLSPAFVEWMMGLPAGWVTDPAIGLTRSEQLKALGNGVVPQQGAAAISDMLDAFECQGADD